MARRPNPLVPLGLFRRRRFATINLSTLLIYGALYTIFYIQGLFLQGTIGYTATAAGVIGLPTGILLTVLSTRVGTLAGRFGARPFLVVGPLLMAGGPRCGWPASPPTREPWTLALGDPSTYVPPLSTIVDVLPFVLLFGVGISLVVAPLTSTLMWLGAGLERRPRVRDQQLDQPDRPAAALGADLRRRLGLVLHRRSRRRCRGFDADDPAMRAQVQPLNPAGSRARHPRSPRRRRRRRSTRMRLASIVCAALLAGGAAANGIGLRAAARRGHGGRGRSPTGPRRTRRSTVG